MAYDLKCLVEEMLKIVPTNNFHFEKNDGAALASPLFMNHTIPAALLASPPDS
jgi:hypothetical protein